jgi:hypothetical protein
MAYSDDAYMIVVSHDFELNKKLLVAEFERCLAWTRESGAEISADKLKVLHLCQRSNARSSICHSPPTYPDSMTRTTLH